MPTRHGPSTPLARVLPAVDLVILGLAFVLAYWIRFDAAPFAGDLTHKISHLMLGLGLLAAWLPALFLLDLYQPARFSSVRDLLGRLGQAVVLVAILAAALLFLLQGKLASRLVFGTTLIGAALGAGLVRLALARWHARRAGALRVLVVGAGVEAARLSGELAGAELVGFLRARNGKPQADPVIGTLAELASILDREVVDHVLVAVPSRDWDCVEQAATACAEIGVDVSIAAPLPVQLLARATPARLFGTPVLRLDSSPQFRAAMVGKRAFDLIMTIALLPFALPIIMLAALCIRLTSPGAAFFAQNRVGLHGRLFRFYKLRTMVDGAHEMQVPNEPEHPAFKPEDDPRVTGVGKILRRLSIDELPQLFNVLKGDMSLVGPRPPLPHEVEQYDRWQRRRLSMRPGLTCTWQVSGRSEVGFQEWMRLDLDYIDNWSPWLDLKILLKTVPAVVIGKGAR